MTKEGTVQVALFRTYDRAKSDIVTYGIDIPRVGYYELGHVQLGLVTTGITDCWDSERPESMLQRLIERRATPWTTLATSKTRVVERAELDITDNDVFVIDRHAHQLKVDSSTTLH